MRLSPWFCLLALGLAAVSIRVSSSLAAPSPPPAPQTTAVSPAGNPSWTEDGYGLTEADAKDNAVEKAQAALTKYLNQHYGEMDWKVVNGDRVLLERLGALRDDDTQLEPIQLDRDRKALGARVRVEVTPSYLQEAQKVARDQRIQLRQLLLAKVLAALVVLLVVVAGYLRLEDATKGYYTTLLRLSAVGVLALVAVGLLVVG